MSKENALIIQDLYDGKIKAIELDQLNVVLNTRPPSDWIKDHPYVYGWKYLPIDKVEFLLKKLFKRYTIEVLKTGVLFNAIEVSVRVHYLNPVLNEMVYVDGVGACELQTQKDSGVLKPDFSNVNKGAVTIALPIAKTLAIKDACDLIGDIFGGNINRKDVVPYGEDSKLAKKQNETQLEREKRIEKEMFAKQISKCDDFGKLQVLENDMIEQGKSNPEYEKMIEDAKQAIIDKNISE